NVRVEIVDTGYGISRENLDHIFDPFFTTKEQGEGTGLGLSIVHSVIKNHGGNIKVSSKVGEGTSFVLNFSTH
ncbi:MAG: HAMP domain-containing histidine kinase, partial [Deltaproteobacteria bacterium]|nr:HAMP domain-containing histidine kinase [Deltaproteobacteria bacterium]